MTTIAVIGLGTMGLGIAQTYAAAGLAVLATDAVPKARETALDRLRAGLAPRVRSGKLAQADLDACPYFATVLVHGNGRRPLADAAE